MLCDICKKNEATIHFTKYVNNEKTEINMCERCAHEKQGLNLPGEFTFDAPFSLKNILSGLMDYINQSDRNGGEKELTCKSCGTTYSEFKEKGILGCSNCYNNFSLTLKPIIRRVQGSSEHVGKVPKKCGANLIQKKKILKLKEELQKVVTLEEYEKAAEIRDEIKRLKEEK